MEKVCIKCSETKDISLFVKKTNRCKECMREYKKQYRISNIEFLREKYKNYYIDNKDKVKEKAKINYENNREKKLIYQKEYADLNKDKISKYKMEYQRNRRKNDPFFKLKYVVGRLIRNSLKCKGLSKNKRTIEILGCDIEFFKNYIEEKFTNDMSWENYGTKWDIDHIKPLCTGKTEDDIINLNHYTNLQPLDSHINRNIKRDKIDFDINSITD